MTRIEAGTTQFQSWGRYPRVRQTVVTRDWRDEPLPAVEGNMLPRGLGRSYGDSCLNEGNTLLSAAGLRRLIRFDEAAGVLRCEAGMTIDDVLEYCVPRGWFPPVTPGTRFVTIGGAVANDIHGKNHHVSGSFGNFVRELELVRSDGTRQICSPATPGLFEATVGGLGLTGMIDQVEFQLRPIRNRWIDAETIRMGGLDDFFALSRESEPDYEYLVAWIDTVGALGRGLFMRGNHNQTLHPREASKIPKPILAVPFDLPAAALSRATIGLFNALYYRKQWRRAASDTADYLQFFYPLDMLLDWNRMYGTQGLLQWQCLVPFEGGPDAIREILEQVHRSRHASFLTVLKTMGKKPSAGMMSFPRPGITLALDFPRRESVAALLERLDSIVAAVGGRLYPAKDARMSPAHFRKFYPRWEEFSRYIDPKFSSSFWRRVTAG